MGWVDGGSVENRHGAAGAHGPAMNSEAHLTPPARALAGGVRSAACASVAALLAVLVAVVRGLLAAVGRCRLGRRWMRMRRLVRLRRRMRGLACRLRRRMRRLARWLRHRMRRLVRHRMRWRGRDVRRRLRMRIGGVRRLHGAALRRGRTGCHGGRRCRTSRRGFVAFRAAWRHARHLRLADRAMRCRLRCLRLPSRTALQRTLRRMRRERTIGPLGHRTSRRCRGRHAARRDHGRVTRAGRHTGTPRHWRATRMARPHVRLTGRGRGHRRRAVLRTAGRSVWTRIGRHPG